MTCERFSEVLRNVDPLTCTPIIRNMMSQHSRTCRACQKLLADMSKPAKPLTETDKRKVIEVVLKDRAQSN